MLNRFKIKSKDLYLRIKITRSIPSGLKTSELRPLNRAKVKSLSWIGLLPDHVTFKHAMSCMFNGVLQEKKKVFYNFNPRV